MSKNAKKIIKNNMENESDGNPPDILRGAQNNNIAEVRAALRVDWKNIGKIESATGMTALHISAIRGNASIVSFLLQQNGVDVGLKDKFDRDPLDLAILSGNQTIIDELFRFRRGLGPETEEPDGSSARRAPQIIQLKPK